MSAPFVSVAVVTCGRAPLHELLLEGYDRQTWSRRELIVVDDSPTPSATFTALQRDDVRYVHLPQRHSVGAKRNLAASLARGSLICQWDDDDHYAPGYLAWATRALAAADFVTFDRWYTLELGSGAFSYWDTRDPLGGPGLPASAAAAWAQRNRLGYGFSFSYRAEVLRSVAAPDTSVGDDLALSLAVRDAGWRHRLLADEQGLALHVLHGGNLSSSHPNRPLPAAFVTALFPHFDMPRWRRACAACDPLRAHA